MKRFKEMLSALFLIAALPLPVAAFENLSTALTVEQQACYSIAMVGMDSVINARLGVPAEHALELASLPVANNTTESYDVNLLRTILDAYLWRDTPHSYAIKIFYGCAVDSTYRKHAMLD